VAVFVLRVESQGKVLGEFPLEDEALVLQLQDASSGELVTTLTLEPAAVQRETAQPALATFGGLPPLPMGDELYKDETMDLVLSNDETISRGLAAIRREARGAPGIINIELPSSSPQDQPDPEAVSAEPVAVPVAPQEPEVDTFIEGPEHHVIRREREKLSLMAELAHDPQRAVPVGGDPLPESQIPTISEDEPAQPEGTEVEPQPPGPPPAAQDRSVTRTLSNGLADLIDAADNESKQPGRPTVTESLPSAEAARPTHVDLGAVSEADEGPPTRVSREPFMPSPVLPSAPDQVRARAIHDDTRPLPDPEFGTEQEVAERPQFVPTDFADEGDEAVTVVAKAPVSRPEARSPLVAGEYDELPVGRSTRGHGDDLSLGLPQDPSLVGPRGYDELPVPPQPRREVGDDLSLSLPYDPNMTDASIDELSLPVPADGGVHTAGVADPSLSLSLPMPTGAAFEADSDDDITLPLPEDSSEVSEHEALDLMTAEPTVTNALGGMQLSALGNPQPVKPRLMDTTAGFERDPSTERLEGAEVWFRRGGEWTPRGALNLGQHVQAFGGMVRCDDNGGLVVLAGPRLHGSATMPSGELRQIRSGQQAVHLPPGTSVIMWQGEQGIYVRSNVAADASGPVLDQGPVVYRRPPRSQAWTPPVSDLDD
jgi:hypothetical protein